MNAVNVMKKFLWVVLVSFCAAACAPIPLLSVTSSAAEGDKEYPKIAASFQKKDRIGRTDYEQRKADMIACGMPPERYNDDVSYIGGSPPGESNQEFLARINSFLQCMEDKGYIWFTAHKCGYLEENRRICNLR
jgi:hypothetical protein